MIYVHKEHELADVEERYPAAYYVMVDDKLEYPCRNGST